MTNESSFVGLSGNTCLTDSDLYDYVSGQGGAQRLGLLEAHLSRCYSCRQNLAGLLKILNPDAAQDLGEIPELSREELDRSIATIRKVSRKERTGRDRFPQRILWPIAAAAAIGFVALGFLVFNHLYETRKTENFFSQARNILEQNYSGTSPDNLRLALPFIKTSTNRSFTSNEDLRTAENLFFQALAFREGMVEAHLGLGCIYLHESRFSLAQGEFQKILDKQKDHVQALIGRGVAKYEEAEQSSDPLQRNALLMGAIKDFNAVLQLDPRSNEARYDKIRALFDCGMHQEALQEIEVYLSRDHDSNWAEELRGLKTRMKATKISAVEKEVHRAARERDEAALWDLARQAPYQMPTAILSSMRQSLELEQAPLSPGSANSQDLRWAAETMEAAYSASTGDHSLKAPLAFYIGLSPPQRAIKRALDKDLYSLGQEYRNGKIAAALRGSKLLERPYAELKDFWQLASLHHLRGNSFYFGMADFSSAEAEFRKMLEIATRLNAPDFMAKAMASLAMIYGMERKFDDSFRCANRLKNLAQTYKLEPWQIQSCVALGNQFRRIGQMEESLHEYAAALETAYRLLDGVTIIETLEHLGEAMDRLGRFQEAKAYYREALLEQDSYLKNRVIQPRPETTVRRLNLLSKQGDLALRTGDFSSAETLFRESLKSHPPGMVELEGRNRVGLAEIYLRTNRIREAKDTLKSAIAIGASGKYPDIEWRAKSLNGRLLERTGNRREALVSLQQSIEVLEHMRMRITPEDLRHSFLTDRFDPFKTMVSLLYESSDGKRKALEFVDRAKSITLRENLEQNGLALDSPIDRAGVEKNPYAIVEYFFADDKLLIFLTSRGQVEAVSRSIPREELSGQVQTFRESIRKNDTKAFIEMARLLYDELIAPIEESALVNSPETLVILPDGPLHLLPFAGLQDRHGRFLIEKTPVTFAPSRSVFQRCLFLDRGRTIGNRAVLIDGSSSLPNAREELTYLSKLYGKNTLILTPKDLPAFSQAVARSEILHFSGHAFNVQGKPALLLQTSPREIYLDCQSINTWRMPHVHLVNLAGCSTGIGPVSEGEAPWGLIPAFLNAGAPAIIASLTPVDDLSTKQITLRFYDLLKNGVSKAKALQRAQLALIETARSGSNVRPQSWLPYILVGNPQ
jgi:CHAT domain-containing protein/thioredoxin-like negative regulator of GroEL